MVNLITIKFWRCTAISSIELTGVVSYGTMPFLLGDFLMISYDTCVAIQELVQLLVDVRTHWMGMKYKMKFGDDVLDAHFGNHAVVFDYNYEVYLNRLKPTASELIGIINCGTIHSLYVSNTSSGWCIEMSDYESSQEDVFGLYSSKTELVGTGKQDVLPVPIPRNEDEFDSAAFQLSTIYDPQVASIVLVNMLVRDILRGTKSKISTNSVLFQLHANEIRTAKKLLQRQFNKLREMEIQ